MNYYNENTIVYFDGAFVKATEARIDFYSQSASIRLFRISKGSGHIKPLRRNQDIQRAMEHFDRLRNSAVAMNMPYPWTSQELIDATYEVLVKK